MSAELLEARRPVVYFANNIGDSILTLPTLRALAEVFSTPLTLLCPRRAFDLCFHEINPHFVDITDMPPALGLSAHRPLDHDAIAAQVGAVDLLINAVPWNMPSNMFFQPLLERLAPTAAIGFLDDGGYNIVLPKDSGHCADLIFTLAQLFDPALRIDAYSHRVPIPPSVREKARSIRAMLPMGTKVLAVHADTGWTAKQWPITRFITVLDQFLARHPDYVVWVVGMGHEELNVGRERERVIPCLGLPLDLAIGLVERADLFLGIDSCMLHAADLARVPGVGLFGPTRSAAWGFRFGPHRHLDMPSTADITVADVVAALDELAGHHG
ncbi:glycosyltransferase family 9 protein [Mycolicibacterium sphagni]|uniref:Glycosyltransferase family 9 protein n=1 Tax=Mycolicibacterium sphagni TaxID=1786 RepID=A0ABX2JVS0_9MYCO|nr:glycosyltransferase family 9 protein [Mycolicibacterium sphagni]NTY60708.1 glycosyltransferase family 9 protein [Mycolicibacterium sphagni]